MQKLLTLSILAILMASCGNPVKITEVRNKEGLLLELYNRDMLTGSKEGYYTRFYPNGDISEEGWYRNDTLHGQRIRYYEGNKKKYIENYHHGKLSGDFRAYHEDGSLKCDYEFIDGKATGIWKTYYHNRQLKEVVTYKDDKLNGPYLEYYPNGKAKAKGVYMNGPNRHGLFEIYDVYGILVKEMICTFGDCQTIWREKSDAVEDL